MPGPAPARTPAKQPPAAPAAIHPIPPHKCTQENNRRPKESSREEHAGNSPDIIDWPRIIKYN
jgi:hypothetical protein